jgi:hypothetical protein
MDKCFTIVDLLSAAAASGFICSLIGVLIGLIMDLKIRHKNRRLYDAGGGDRASMLEDPQKTKTKCGQPYCRADQEFILLMGGQNGREKIPI